MTPDYQNNVLQCGDGRIGRPPNGLSIGSQYGDIDNSETDHLNEGNQVVYDNQITARTDEDGNLICNEGGEPHEKQIHGTNCCGHAFCGVYSSLIELKPGVDELGGGFGGSGYVINQFQEYNEPIPGCSSHPDLLLATTGIERAQDHYGCVSFENSNECPYRSNILVEITESI